MSRNGTTDRQRRGSHAQAAERRLEVESMYYKVVGVILLFPWSILVLTVAGHLRARWARKA